MVKFFSSPHALTLALIAATMLVLEVAQSRQTPHLSISNFGPEQSAIVKAGFYNRETLHL